MTDLQRRPTPGTAPGFMPGNQFDFSSPNLAQGEASNYEDFVAGWTRYLGQPNKDVSRVRPPQSVYNLDEAWVGENIYIRRIIINRVLQKDAFYEIMPPRNAENFNDVYSEVLIFRPYLPTLVPEQSVPRIVDSRTERTHNTLRRYGIGWVMSSDFFKSAEGRTHYAAHLIQISEAFKRLALLNIAKTIFRISTYRARGIHDPSVDQPYPGMNVSEDVLVQMLQAQASQFDCARLAYGLDKIISDGARALTARGNVATHVILPQEIKSVRRYHPANTMPSQRNSLANSLGDASLQVIWSTPFQLTENQSMDPTRVHVAFGENYPNDSNAALRSNPKFYDSQFQDLYIFDERRGLWAPLHIEESMRCTGLYEMSPDGKHVKKGMFTHILAQYPTWMSWMGEAYANRWATWVARKHVHTFGCNDIFNILGIRTSASGGGNGGGDGGSSSQPSYADALRAAASSSYDTAARVDTSGMDDEERERYQRFAGTFKTFVRDSAIGDEAADQMELALYELSSVDQGAMLGAALLYGAIHYALHTKKRRKTAAFSAKEKGDYQILQAAVLTLAGDRDEKTIKAVCAELGVNTDELTSSPDNFSAALKDLVQQILANSHDSPFNLLVAEATKRFKRVQHKFPETGTSDELEPSAALVELWKKRIVTQLSLHAPLQTFALFAACIRCGVPVPCNLLYLRKSMVFQAANLAICQGGGKFGNLLYGQMDVQIGRDTGRKTISGAATGRVGAAVMDPSCVTHGVGVISMGHKGGMTVKMWHPSQFRTYQTQKMNLDTPSVHVIPQPPCAGMPERSEIDATGMFDPSLVRTPQKQHYVFADIYSRFWGWTHTANGTFPHHLGTGIVTSKSNTVCFRGASKRLRQSAGDVELVDVSESTGHLANKVYKLSQLVRNGTMPGYYRQVATDDTEATGFIP